MSADIQKLIGRRITAVKMPVDEKHDDMDTLILTLDNGDTATIIAFYGDYTGESRGEYPSYISVFFDPPNPPDQGAAPAPLHPVVGCEPENGGS
jgi:hypothetical protein